MGRQFLALDPGSSSLKFAIFEVTGGPGESALKSLVAGLVDRLGSDRSELRIEASGKPPMREGVIVETFAQAVELALRRIYDIVGGDSGKIQAIGCRVVHGGDLFSEPTRVTTEVIKAIRDFAPLAPLHNQAAAEVLETCLRLLPNASVVAVFDTAFHHALPAAARTYALPHKLCEQHHIRRYGFHGIAHKYVSCRLIELIGKADKQSRCITCHLGSGSSICAVKDGKSIDTSMGMTPMEGLVMGNRSGDVDPGILLFLQREAGLSLEALDGLLNNKSGLLGISGKSSDLRDLEEAAAEGDGRAELAMEVFAYRVAKTIGAYTVAMGGLDAIAFSGGIGENSALMRRRICSLLLPLDVQIDPIRNSQGFDGDSAFISRGGTSVQVWIIKADENLQIALDTLACIKTGQIESE